MEAVVAAHLKVLPVRGCVSAYISTIHFLDLHWIGIYVILCGA